jgi:hypothetical protein
MMRSVLAGFLASIFEPKLESRVWLDKFGDLSYALTKHNTKQLRVIPSAPRRTVMDQWLVRYFTTTAGTDALALVWMHSMCVSSVINAND